MLDAEQAQDEAVLQERLSNWSIDRLKQEGYCITGMSAYWTNTKEFGRPVASFSLGAGIDLPDHKFEGGTQILATRLDMDPLHEEPYKGSVLSRTATQLRVAFPELFDLDQAPWRLDVGRSNMVYDRMRAAISLFNLDPQDQESYISAPERQLILQGTHLRDVLLRSFSPAASSINELHHIAHEPHHLQPEDDTNYVPHSLLEHEARYRAPGDHGGAFKDDMRIQSWTKRYARVNPVRVEGDPVLEGLNKTQLRAVALMIGERASLVQGPPGTGKTKTIIETVKLLKVHFQVPHPIMVCTYTNVAVDNLVEGLAASGVKPLRVGYGGKVKKSLYPHTLESKLENHALRPEFERLTQEGEQLRKRSGLLQKKIRELSKKADSGDEGGAAVARARQMLERAESEGILLERQENILRSKLYAVRQEMLHDIIAQADVVCTTCITSASAALRIIDFPVVFLDEASMSTEPASLIPIMKGSRHLALIGDHKQLPPVITSREAQVKGLGISLFERLTEEGDVPSIMLDLQYRMHPSISRFPSEEFYNFSLLDGTVDASGNVRSSLLPPTSSHLVLDPNTGKRPSVVFIDHSGQESSRDRSKVNWEEAGIVVKIVEDLLSSNPDLKGENIGIIAPYVAQISLLTRFLHTSTSSPTTSNPWSSHLLSTLGSHRCMQLPSIEIKTVDGFEGREKDIIIFSTVRNNDLGQIGFLADRRRLNVGLTRAKRGLFVVGSLRTLRESGTGTRGPSAVLGGGTGKMGKGAEAWRRYVKWLGEEGLVRPVGGNEARRESASEEMDRVEGMKVGGYREDA